MQKRILPIIALSMALITPVVIQGCSSQSETTTSTTTTSEEPQAAPTTTTTTSTTTTSNEPDSVLGATFHAIGTIILFPFRLVGDAIGLIV
jgi:ABC-type enterochelin transport system substrate-binding protein